MNYDLRKHCELFFARQSIDAADFSGRVTNMLMRYRVQTVPAQLNVLDSHDVSRFLSLCGGDTGKYRLAVLFMMTFVGMPTVFYGDELGLQGVQEEEYRKSMAWEGGDRALLDFFQRAIAMRRTLRPLTRGSFRMINPEPGSGLIVFRREYAGEAVVVCIHRGGPAAGLPPIRGRCFWSQGLEGGRLRGGGFAVFTCP